jgi:hypothetical protein
MTLSSRRLGSGFQLLAILLCFSALFADTTRTGFSDALSSPDESAAYESPATVSAFISASTMNDKATLWKVTSPVYWLELRRRGVELSQEGSDTILKTLGYLPIGGARDGYGYGHWLYSTLARSQRGDRILTIWRFDTDPSDLVLWVEPGVLLANSCGQPIRDLTPRSVALSSDPPTTATLVLSARCPESGYGYYILQAAGARGFTFASIHENGETYRANWTFGHVLNSREATIGHGYFLVDRVLKSPAEDASRSYLRDLEQVTASSSNPGR